MKLLAVGDMHLGRRPSRLPRSLADRARELGPGRAWARAVDAALDENVNAVVLSGDVVERENDFFEAYGELYGGVRKLASAGIRVLGVVGNHDAAVLPRLAEEIEGFEVLGRGGKWQSVEIQSDGESLTLWGASYCVGRGSESPLRGARFERGAGVNLGLLHCDRDQSDSRYAPVTSRELEAAGLDGWLLGHIHQPDRLSASNPAGYLGSITGLDPGEPGPRGPWLIGLESRRICAVEHLALAPLRWERMDVSLEGVSAPEEARVRLLSGLRAFDAEWERNRFAPDAVGLRVTFSGRSRFGEAATELFSEEDREHIFSGERGTHYFIERIDAATRPEVQLEDLARRTDPPGLLARRILTLDRPHEDRERRALLAEARKRFEGVAGDERWTALRPDAPDEQEVANWLRHSGMRLLEKLLAQREAGE